MRDSHPDRHGHLGVAPGAVPGIAPAPLSLDALRQRALAGDRTAEAALFADLRARFLVLARRRVQPDHAEDVVQQALGIVLQKYRRLPPERGILVWSLTILRNVVGNHYQDRRRSADQIVRVADWCRLAECRRAARDPFDRVATAEDVARIEAAIAELARSAPRCGTVFDCLRRSIEQGGAPREVSARALVMVQAELPGLTRNAFYVSLHRCRARLRAILDRLEGSG
jgi:DNA-directed RNA polymerase specialized sigma24 family protein